jgi:type IV pilus assembly protein PilB
MKNNKFKDDFIQLLSEGGFVSPEKSQHLAKLKGIPEIEQYIRQQKWIDEEALTKIKAKLYTLLYVDLGSIRPADEILNIIPKEIAENYRALVFEKDKNLIKVALVNPTDLKAREAIEFLARKKNLKIDYYLASASAFNSLLKHYGNLKIEVKEALDIAQDKFEVPTLKTERMEEVIKSAPVSKMVSVIIRHGVDARASDIHIEPGPDQTRVRYRVDGVLQTSLVLPKYIHSAVISRVKVMANLKIDETRLPQDGRIRMSISNRSIDFRVSTMPLYNNEKVVMRILDTSGGSKTLEDLGFWGRNIEVMKENIQLPTGMFLVTGPTGSGKSTTLYATLRVLNEEGVNITTLEDPIEYFLDGINQTQVQPEVGLSFATGLRSVLRQDPDIIMVGEIRDSETAELAIHAALTGHIVLSTLHTNNAFGAVPRLIDMGQEAFLLASTINVIIAQRLLRKICDQCKAKTDVTQSMVDQIKVDLEKIDPKLLPQHASLKKGLIFYKGKGCEHCGQTGFSGRTVISEVLSVDDDIKTLIAERAEERKFVENFKQQGMLTLKQDGIIKVLRGDTSLEEMLRVTKD